MLFEIDLVFVICSDVIRESTVENVHEPNS